MAYLTTLKLLPWLYRGKWEKKGNDNGWFAKDMEEWGSDQLATTLPGRTQGINRFESGCSRIDGHEPSGATTTNRYLNHLNKNLPLKSESELVYHQSVRLGPKPLENHGQILFSQLIPCSHSPNVTSSLTRGWVCCLQLLLALASATVADSWLPQPGGSGPRIYVLQEQGGSLIPPATGLLYSSEPCR
jgi:hypothetical protein